MKNLAQHIEELIIQHECVIVPGLGGFVTYRDKASIRNNRLYAPTTRIRFNSLLTYHDGLLAEAYMQDRHISYSNALEAIKADVEQIVTSLNTGNTFIFGRIGALMQIDGNIVLRDNNCKFLPENMGLPVVQLKRLATTQPTNSITINIPQTSSNALRYVASIAVIFILTLFVPNHTHQTSQRASISFDSLRNIKNIEYDIQITNDNNNTQENSELTTEKTETTQASIKSTTETPTFNTQLPTLDSKYHLIIASLTSHEDAEEYIANHSHFNQSQLQIIESKGKYRISAAGFNKYKDALQYMDSIRNEVPIAKNAWVMCK